MWLAVVIGMQSFGWTSGLVVLVACEFTLLHADIAQACSPRPPRHRTIAAVSPADGATDFPRNGGIQFRIRLTEMSRDALARVQGSAESYLYDLTIHVIRSKDEEEVLGDFAIDQDSSDTSETVTWVAREPLDADTEYRVELSIPTNPTTDNPGPTTSITTFETGDDLVPELKLSGRLRAKLRGKMVPVLDCWPCGNCREVDERPALLADVTLPRVSGGYLGFGYSAWLTLNDTEPATFDGPGEGSYRWESFIQFQKVLQPKPDVPQVVTIEVEQNGELYRACFGFNAADPSGQSKSAEPFCVSEHEMELELAKLDALAAGCSVSQRARTPSSWAPYGVLLTLALLVGRSRRRRTLR